MIASKTPYVAEFREEAGRLEISSQKGCAEIAQNLGIQHHQQHTAAGRPQFTVPKRWS